MSESEQRLGLIALLKDLESPLDEARMAALGRLADYPSLAALRLVRRLASVDGNPSVRMEARRCLTAIAGDVRGGQLAGSYAGRPTAERLEAMLREPDPATRARVVRVLATMLDPAVPRLLTVALERESDPFVVCALLQALAATLGPAAAALMGPHLANPDPRVRATAVESLAATGEPSVLEGLIPMLADPHDRVRVAAARALQAQEREAVLEAIDQMLASTHELSVRSALYVLRCFDDEVSLPRLTQGLRSASQAARGMARESIWFRVARGSAAAAALAGGLARADGVERPGDVTEVFESDELAPAHPEPLEEPLEAALAGADPQRKVDALLRAVRQGRSDLAERVLAALDAERHPRVLATTISAAGRLAGPPAVARLLPFLAHEEPRVRANAVEAAGLLDAAGNVSELAAALGDPNNRVRANAVMALAGIGGTGALETLDAMADSHNARFQISAIYAATVIGTPRSVSVLARLLASDDRGISGRARGALESLASVLPEAAAALTAAADERRETESARAAAPLLPDELVQRSLFDLQHESPVVRLRTLQGLANTPDRRLLAAVRRLLRDDDSAVRHAALQSVRAMLLHCGGTGSQAAAASLSDFERRLAGDPEEALTALQSTIDVALVAGADDVARLLMRLGPAEREPTVRASLVSSLALVGGAAAAALYRALLRDPDARVRANAVDAIELAGNDADLLATASCLADPSPRVRGAAIRACVRVSKDRFLSHLQGMLSADAVADRAAALHVARTLQFPERFDFLRDHFLAEAHPRLSEASAAALASEAVAGRRDEVLSLLAQLPAGGRRKCLRAALGLPPESNEPDAGPTLVASSGVPLDAETSGSFEMVWGLQQQGQLTPQLVRQKLASHSDPLTTVTLLQAVADQRLADAFDLTQPFTYARDRRVRLAAIAVLGGLDDPRTRACLWSLVKDRDAEVSRRALAALAATAPESAFHAACSLLEMSQPAAVRRGLELLGEMGQPAALAAVLQSLRLHVHSSTIEPLEKLVLRWGTTATLEELAAIYGDTPANARLFVAELTQTLAAHLGLPAPALTAKLPAGQMFSEAGQGLPPGQAGLAEPPAGGAVSSHRAVMAGAFVYAAVVAVVVWMVLPPDQSLAHYRAIGREENPVARPAGVKVEFRTGLAPRELGGVVQSSFDSMLRDALAANVTPTVRQVEDALRERLAAQGIRSQAFVHLVALDRVECAYQAELERAREAVQARRFDRAIELLSAALAATDPEHLVARLDLLRELELACRLGARPELARDYENQMAACERKMLEICLQAAREKGLPESTLRAALTAFDARQQRRGKARAVLELFSPPAPSSVH